MRKRLRTKLPPYMMPSHVETIDRLPTLPSGKVDKRSLPPPRPRAPTTRVDVSGDDPIEELVRTTFASTLGLASVARDAHFFDDLGGHSLLATRVVSALRRKSQFSGVSVLDLYRHPTVETLARRVKRMAEAPASAQPRTNVRSVPFVAAQAMGSLLAFALHAAQWLAPYVTFALARAHGVTIADAIARACIALFATPPATIAFAVALKWIVVGRFTAGRHALGSAAHLRAWIVERVLAATPIDLLAGTPWMNVFLRAMGARIGKNVHVATAAIGAFDLVDIGDDATVGIDATIAPSSIEEGERVLAPSRSGARCTVETRAFVQGGATMEDDAALDALALLPRGETKRPIDRDRGGDGVTRPTRAKHLALAIAYALAILAFPIVHAIAIAPAAAVLAIAERWIGAAYLVASPIAALVFVVALCLEVVVLKWMLLGRVRSNRRPIASTFAWRKWIVDRTMATTFDALGALYATLWLVPFLRALGMRIGRLAEISTASDFTPDLVRIGDGAFVADCVSLGAPRFDRGWMTLGTTSLGDRAFIGNSGLVPCGATLADDTLVACMSTAPDRSLRGESFVGAPPLLLPRRAPSLAHAIETTFRPTRALVARRRAIEAVRVLLPTTIWIVLTCLVVAACGWIDRVASLPVAIAALPLLAALAGALSAAFVVAFKWIVVGRHRAGTHPLWSSFVWRTELVTALQENVVDPLWNEMLLGTPMAAWFFRALGAKIGRRVHLGTTQLTEYDLVEIADDACLDEDCTLQTHLFEDRVMKTSRVRVGEACSVGRDAIVLYDGEMGRGASLGPMSLAMKGESLPAATRWRGIPARPAGA